MTVRYPLFVFEKDNYSIHRIEREANILGQLEAIDIENDEYVIWDSNGAGVSIQVSVGAFRSKLISVISCSPALPVRDAFLIHAKDRGISLVPGEPQEMWNQIRQKRESDY